MSTLRWQRCQNYLRKTKSSSYKNALKKQCKYSQNKWKNKVSGERSSKLKNIATAMKNSMDKFNSKMKMTEERKNLRIDQQKLSNPNNRKKEVKKK